MDSGDHVSCQTGLVLRLGCHANPAESNSWQFSDPQEKKKTKKKAILYLNFDNMFPSDLRLGLSEDHHHHPHHHKVDKVDVPVQGDQQANSSASTVVSSFSNSSSFKIRDKSDHGETNIIDQVEPDVELDQRDSFNFSRLSTDREDEDQASPRKKLRLSKEQSSILEDSFKDHANLNPKQKQDLAKRLTLKPRQVEVWFQNRRARTKLKQTEVDCELLKKSCETLAEENKRLMKELQEIKSMKLPAHPPLLMQLQAAATLTLCPSCNKICSADGSPKTPFSNIIRPKPEFLNPFNHTSAAF